MWTTLSLAQCPCSGGEGGTNPFLVLAVVAATWWLASMLISAWQKKRGVTAVGKWGKIAIVAAVAVAVVLAIALKRGKAPGTVPKGGKVTTQAGGEATDGLPRLVDLGAGMCIPCKMMAPILEELRKEYEGRLDVVVIDVNEEKEEAARYKIDLIPTQIFFDPSGKELFRHEGFFSKEDILAKWKELGFDFAGSARTPAFERLEPAQKDTRPRGQVCYMCDGDIDPKTLVVVKTAKGDVRLCGPHHYFVMYSCLTGDKAGFEKKVSVTDWATGKLVPATVNARYPGLTFGALTFAWLSDLPKGMLLRCDGVEITAAALNEMMRANFGFPDDYAGRLNVVYLDGVATDVTVTDDEVTRFYEENTEMFGGAKLRSIRKRLTDFVRDRKRREAWDKHLQQLAEARHLVVSAPWVKEHAALARGNPADRARASGRPSVVDFGADGCRSCEKMKPILAALKEKYAGRVNIVFVHARQETVLATRYRIRSIPTQIFYDKSGKEVFRHTGYFSQRSIERKLREMGVQ